MSESDDDELLLLVLLLLDESSFVETSTLAFTIFFSTSLTSEMSDDDDDDGDDDELSFFWEMVSVSSASLFDAFCPLPLLVTTSLFALGLTVVSLVIGFAVFCFVASPLLPFLSGLS